ncbi:MAG: CRISPR-associated protein Cas4 [Planctomycetes bacterium]|nr:CRISPR-associated protein Cas4 [Planctomycetota bacterium]
MRHVCRDLLPLSAIEHLVYCERQWGLIHLEGVWTENRLTAEGRRMHERAHDPQTEVRGDVRTARGLRIRSLRLGLVGKADVVEFHRTSDRGHEPSPHSGRLRVPGSPESLGVELPGVAGLWLPFPVEYKRGRRRHEEAYKVQLCAQAICLEEMLGAAIPRGALFYGKSKRHMEIEFDDTLRVKTEQAAVRLHRLTTEGKTPPAVFSKKCERCSLLDHCMPRATGSAQSVRAYLAQAIKDSGRGIP